jgi:hypothetical protein
LHYTWHTRPSIFAGQYLAVLQIRGAAPKIKIYYSIPVVCGIIEIVRQLEKDFEPKCMFFKELKAEEGEKQAASITVFRQIEIKY